jgi:uncharacterized protein YkwD
MSVPAVPALAALTALAACAATPVSQTRMGPDGRPLPVVYRISASEAPRVQLRMRDAVSALRQARGLSPVELNAQLTSAAATQARDMAAQGRPWHFGADGSSPIERVQRVGYPGAFLGELISETYETELETLAGWMDERETRAVLLDTQMREIGFSWYQEPTGKLWWVMTTGAPFAAPGA